MGKDSTQDIAGLLEKAGSMGIDISVGDNNVVVKYPRGRKVDPLFINELKSNKHELVEYLTTRMANGSKLKPFVHNGKTYYEISLFMHYWVNEDDKAFKETIVSLLSFRITGPLDVAVFKKAVSFLTNRHESLRSTFHKIGENYYMHVEDPGSSQYEVDYRDMRKGPFIDEGDANHPRHFPGHVFDLEKGPLFLIRLLQVKDNEFIVALKSHHSIYDQWSFKILQRDLYSAYFAFLEGKEPDLPVLQKQYKDYIADMNFFASNTKERDKQYWNSLHKELPGSLMIPGAKKTASTLFSKPGKEEYFTMPPGNMGRINELAGKHEVSVFIVLQALVKTYLAKPAGQYDIVIGTLVFGREELPASEDQIGLYSKMLFIRTVLDPGDSLGKTILKVKKSNEDMRKHQAFPLLSVMNEKIPVKPEMTDTFWKVNLHYSDEQGFYVAEKKPENAASPGMFYATDMPGLARDNHPTDLDLKLHFYNFERGQYLSIMYDSEAYDLAAVNGFVAGLFTFMEETLSAPAL